MPPSGSLLVLHGSIGTVTGWVGALSLVRCRHCAMACPACHNERMRVVRVGAAGTAQELSRLFRGVPIVLSTPSQPRGIVPDIGLRRSWSSPLPAQNPVYVGGTPRNANTGPWAILDAWTSLYASALTRA